ncbi:MAG TPA: hypothetical protein VFC19_49535 [Candidatus Limnocylindrales bacterium]|nr:hypothetical protein [Candidatus Limnocylindrales bacterium]
MAQRKIPARDIIVQVETSTPGTWVAIGGLTSVTPNPSENEETADATTYESVGQYEQLVMQRGAAMELEGFLLKDHVSGAQDTGQARCETIATGIGYTSLGSIRFRHPADTLWKVWATATFSVGEQGGGNNDLTSWSATITRSGASTTAAV